jgi:RNA polymerase sigma-70 factor, ECF subfamily
VAGEGRDRFRGRAAHGPLMRRRNPLANPEPLIQRVYAYVAYRMGDGPDAEDVTSAVFERALRYRDSFDPSVGEPIAWLLGIARRCVAESFGGDAVPFADMPEQAAEGDLEADSVTRLTLWEALACSSRRDRDLLALRYGADLSARQIAELTGSPTNAVEVALHRALGRLRERLRAADARGQAPPLDPTSRRPEPRGSQR